MSNVDIGQYWLEARIMNMYATRYLKDLLNLFKREKKTRNNTWITVQFGKDTPLYVGYEEKREISTWKFEAWIAPRALHEDSDEAEKRRTRN